MIKCCGAERTTPFCPRCGNKLINPSPIIGVRNEYKKKLDKAVTILEKANRYYLPNYPNHSELVKAVKEEARLRKIVEALDEGISNLANPAKVMADWLQDNGYEEAGKALLGAFTGVPS